MKRNNPAPDGMTLVEAEEISLTHDRDIGPLELLKDHSRCFRAKGFLEGFSAGALAMRERCATKVEQLAILRECMNSSKVVDAIRALPTEDSK